MPHVSIRQLVWGLCAILPTLAAGAAMATEKVTIAASQTAILVWLAEERGYFEEEGFDVEIRKYQSGSTAADAVIAGEADLSTSSESAFVSRSLTQPDLRILTTISASRTARLVGRRDRGIASAKDLIGKRVGVTKKSTGDFFLGRYLLLNGVSADGLELVNLKPADIAAALARGEIDAGLTWDPFIYRAEVELGDEAVVLPGQEGQFFYFMLVAKAGWIEGKPQAASAVLRALLRAEAFAIESDEAAKRLIQEKFGYETDYLDHLWPLHSLRVGLPQDLLFVMEEQAKWRIRTRLTERQSVPNYLDFVTSRPLSDIRASAVGIIQ